MAYVTTGDAGFRISALKFGATTLLGAIRATLEKIIEREVLQAEEENTPVARPVDRIDARAVYGILDGSSVIDETAAPANCVADFKEADGSAGSVTIGPMVAGGWTANLARNQGGHQWEQEFQMEGVALTETISF